MPCKAWTDGTLNVSFCRWGSYVMCVTCVLHIDMLCSPNGMFLWQTQLYVSFGAHYLAVTPCNYQVSQTNDIFVFHFYRKIESGTFLERSVQKNSTPLHIIQFFKMSSSIDGYKFWLFYHMLFTIVIYILLGNLE